ncbi:DUF2750 domain-containing protein [Sandaracinus amylolyticus]|uniref:DUF2750 domain-containing protein n=1 Tax=Sandaracinus amylolyticus TaxID=927083 RepID=A0A0F6W5A6_9BACT|nr:DUF2750 domain-containing protein [Sandaracinus amylolyticus]AKF07850.1 hypothetical protein DB32_004999 [Sandaracinus amylolyticus]
MASSTGWHPSDREIASVLRLNRDDRYAYAVKHIADEAALWSLRSDDGYVSGDAPDGAVYVAVWPHPRYAAACAVDAWAGCEAVRIDLDAWLERWTPGLTRDQRFVAVFPVPGEQRVIVAQPDRFAADLVTELDALE